MPELHYNDQILELCLVHMYTILHFTCMPCYPIEPMIMCETISLFSKVKNDRNFSILYNEPILCFTSERMDKTSQGGMEYRIDSKYNDFSFFQIKGNFVGISYPFSDEKRGNVRKSDVFALPFIMFIANFGK